MNAAVAARQVTPAVASDPTHICPNLLAAEEGLSKVGILRHVSRENVDIVKELHDALVAGDWERATDLVVPEVEFHGTVGGLEEGRVARGIDQYRHLDEEDLEAWDERRLEAEGFDDVGDCVVILQREYRRGKGSGVEVEAEIAILVDVHDGRVARIQGYMDRRAGIEAAMRKAGRSQSGV